MRSDPFAWIPAALGLVLYWPFLGQVELGTFEPDVPVLLKFAGHFLEFFSRFDFSNLPTPKGPPQYYDGQFILYAWGAGFAKGLQGLSLVPASWDKPTLILLAIRMLHYFLFSLAATCMYLLARELSRSRGFSLLLASVFLINPQMVAIDLDRVDYFVFSTFTFSLYCSVMLLRRGPSPATLVPLAAAAALVLSSKITGLMFTLVPALALALARLKQHHLRLFLAVFLPSMAILFLRYLYWIDYFPIDLANKIRNTAWWADNYGLKPYFLYSWDAFLPYGGAFLVSFFWALAIVLIHFSQRMHRIGSKGMRIHVLVLSTLLVFTIAGIPSYKFQRGGYHFVPLYLGVLASAFRVFYVWMRFWRVSAGARTAAKASFYGLIFVTLFTLVPSYGSTRERIRKVPAAIVATRVEPRNWLKSHVRPGSSVGYFGYMEWSLPKLSGLDLKLDTRTLVVPWMGSGRNLKLDEEKVFAPWYSKVDLSGVMPPSLEEVETALDLIVLSDPTINDVPGTFGRRGLLREQEAWTKFFDSLSKRYRRVRFESSTPNYGTRWIEIYVIRPAALKVADD